MKVLYQFLMDSLAVLALLLCGLCISAFIGWCLNGLVDHNPMVRLSVAHHGNITTESDFVICEAVCMFLGLALAILPVLHFLRNRTKKRQENTPLALKCLTCGYDLRATPDQCPECGTPAAGSLTPAQR